MSEPRISTWDWADDTKERGYTYWTDKPTTPGVCGTVAFIPQTAWDGWDAFCSCGGWRAFGSFGYSSCTRDEMINALREKWNEHVSQARKEG